MIENLNPIQFLYRSIEYRDPLHRKSARRKTTSISEIVIQSFLITRKISYKELNSALDKKNCHVDKSGYHDDIYAFIYEDINGTLTACGGDVTFWKLKKILISHRQPYYR